MQNRFRLLWLGALETLPLVVAAFPFGIVFGALAQSGGLSFAVTAGMSAIVFAGASQFIAITLLGVGTALPVIVLTVFIPGQVAHDILAMAELQFAAIRLKQFDLPIVAGCD